MTSHKNKTVPVSERALIQRINRALAKDGERLRKARSVQTTLSVGDYYVLDVQKNFIAHQHVDLDHLGRELKVLHRYEHLVD